MDKNFKKINMFTIIVACVYIFVVIVFSVITVHNNNLHMSQAFDINQIRNWQFVTIELGYLSEFIGTISLILVSINLVFVYINTYSKNLKNLFLVFLLIVISEPIISGVVYFVIERLSNRVIIDNMDGLGIYYIIGFSVFIVKAIVLSMALIKTRMEIILKTEVS